MEEVTNEVVICSSCDFLKCFSVIDGCKRCSVVQLKFPAANANIAQGIGRRYYRASIHQDTHIHAFEQTL